MIDGALIHLVAVHVPAMACLFAAILLALAMRWNDVRLQKFCFLTYIGSAIFAAIAYYSGPDSVEYMQSLDSWNEAVNVQAELHALWGQGSFLGMVVLGLGSMMALLGYVQGQPPSKWLVRGLLLAGLVLFVVLVWTAHEGGVIRRPEMTHS
jgi:hypothetical protein